jgi:hypothetical protein
MGTVDCGTFRSAYACLGMLMLLRDPVCVHEQAHNAPSQQPATESG